MPAAAGEHVGQMEHASVAAFARFAPQLLSLGAPPELVEGATRAVADETRHARQAFGLASRYARRALGPGSLGVQRAPDDAPPLPIVRLVVREGCIGETAAALEAREAAEHAVEPRLAPLLRAVAGASWRGRSSELPVKWPRRWRKSCVGVVRQVRSSTSFRPRSWCCLATASCRSR